LEIASESQHALLSQRLVGLLKLLRDGVDVITENEIAAFGVALANMSVTEGHFYTDNGLISVPNLAAMKAL